MVTPCINRQNIQEFRILPTEFIDVFCSFLRTASISLHSIYWLVLITETARVYCMVRMNLEIEVILVFRQ